MTRSPSSPPSGGTVCSLCNGEKSIKRLTGYANQGRTATYDSIPCPQCAARCPGGKHPTMELLATRLIEGEPAKIHQTHRCPQCGIRATTALEASLS